MPHCDLSHRELGKHRQKSKAKRGRMEEDDSEESDDASHDGDDLSDEEMEFGDDEEFKNVFASADDDVAEDGEAASFEDESGGFDEEAAAFSDSSGECCVTYVRVKGGAGGAGNEWGDQRVQG